VNSKYFLFQYRHDLHIPFSYTNLQDSHKKKKDKGKSKNKKRKEREAEEEANGVILELDSRFSSVYHDPEFAIDKLDPRFKNTKNMQKLLETVQQKHTEPKAAASKQAKKQQADDDQSPKKGGADDLAALVKRVKSLQKSVRPVAK
jgi:uncharacterized FlaG/YvyC family protein